MFENFLLMIVGLVLGLFYVFENKDITFKAIWLFSSLSFITIGFFATSDFTTTTSSSAAYTVLISNVPTICISGFQNVNLQSALYPPDTPATSNAVFKMTGLGNTIRFTPALTGNILLNITGFGQSPGAVTGWNLKLQYGTGTAPVFGSNLVGSNALYTIHQLSTGVDSDIPFKFYGVVNALSIGTSYWFDVAIERQSGGSSNIKLGHVISIISQITASSNSIQQTECPTTTESVFYPARNTTDTTPNFNINSAGIAFGLGILSLVLIIFTFRTLKELIGF